MTRGLWLSSIGIGLLASAAVFTDTWPYVLMAVPGVVFVAVSLAYPRAALLLWVLLAPIATLYGTVSIPGGIPDITFTRVTLAVVTAGLFLRGRVQGRRLLSLDAPELAMLALLVVLAADLMARASDVPSEALQHFDERVAPFVLFLLARNLFGRAGDTRRVAWAVALASCLLAAHGGYQFLRGGTPGITDAPVSLTVREGGQRTQESHLEEGRAVGPFNNATEFGSVVAIGFGAALFLALHATSGWSRVVPAAMLAPIGFAIVASLTRSAWLAAYAALLAMLVLDRSRRTVLLAGIGAMTVVLAVVYLSSGASSALRERAESGEPISGRLVMYEVALDLALERPLTGYGSGAPARQAARRKLFIKGGTAAELAPGQFHNVFLMILVEWGVGGLVAWTLVLAALVRGAWMLRARTGGDGGDPYHFAGAFLFATIVYVTQCVFVDTPPFLYLNGLYFFLAGVLFAQLDALSPADLRLPVPSTVPATVRA